MYINRYVRRYKPDEHATTNKKKIIIIIVIETIWIAVHAWYRTEWQYENILQKPLH